jgi:hypothetical protein
MFSQATEESGAVIAEDMSHHAAHDWRLEPDLAST